MTKKINSHAFVKGNGDRHRNLSLQFDKEEYIFYTKRMMKNFKKGQIVLFVIILLVISVIIVSSAVSRSLTGSKTTTINTDSSRAFNAAESGIEELLNKSPSELAHLAHDGPTPYDIQSVDPSSFSEQEYQVEELAYETPDVVAQDSLLQFDFSGDPADLQVLFDNIQACVLVSAISSTGSVSRSLTCGQDPDNKFNNEDTATPCGSYYCTDFISYTSSLETVLIKILSASTKIKLTTSDDVYSMFLTTFIKGTSSATTKSGVKKKIEVTTKTTKDIFPVFDYALYIK